MSRIHASVTAGPDDAEQKPARRGDFSLVKLIVPYVLRERRLYILSLLLLPLSILFPLALPRIVKEIVDHRLHSGMSRELVTGVGILLAVVGMNFLVMYQFQCILRNIGLRIMRALRTDLYARLQSFPIGYFRHESRGRIVARLPPDLDQIDPRFASGGLMLVADCLSVLAIGVAMLDLSVPLGLWGLSVIPFMAVTVTWLSHRMRSIIRIVRTLTARMNSFAQEALSAHDVIAVLAARDHFRNDFDKIASEFETTTLTANRYESAFFAGIDFFGSLAVAMVVYGAIGVTGITAGLMIAMAQYVQQFFVPLRGLATRFSTFQQAMVALERIDHLMRLPVEPQEAPVVDSSARGIPGKPVRKLQVKDLDFSYRAGTPVLKNVSLDIEPGIHMAMLGETGSGKSTFARILCGFYRQDRGTVAWGGSDLDAIPLRERRKIVSLVPQEVFLFDASVEENIRLGRDVADADLSRIIAAVGLEQVCAREQAGTDGGATIRTGLGEWGRRLSEGEKQLIAAARIIVYNPDMVVLDEATSSLDPLLDASVRAAIRKALEGRSAIIIAHRLSTLQSADAIAVMHKGSVVETGTHEELIARGEYYAKLYRLMELSEVTASHGARERTAA